MVPKRQHVHENNLINIIKSLQMDLKELEELYQTPILYLSNHFNNLRREINIAETEQASTKKEIETSNKLNDNFIKMINKVNEFEQECLKLKDQNILKLNETKETVKAIQLIKEKINYLSVKELKQDENNEDFSSYILDIEDLIYDATVYLERTLFLNKTMVFLEEKTNKVDKLFSQMDNSSSAGKLLLITNEYFGKRGLTLITR